jgi:hypothetical protein
VAYIVAPANQVVVEEELHPHGGLVIGYMPIMGQRDIDAIIIPSACLLLRSIETDWNIAKHWFRLKAIKTLP